MSLDYYLSHSGPFGLVVLFLGLVCLVLAARAAWRVRRPDGADPATIRSIHAVLFWGSVSWVLGLLGQYSGIFKSLIVISRARAIDPRLVAQGFAESFTTTLAGMTVLVLSALAWFLLLTWHGRRRRPQA